MASEESFCEYAIEYDPEIVESLNSEELINQKNKKVLKWGVEDTRFMLDLYVDGQKEVGPMKKYRLKKEMWSDIANKLSEKFCGIYTALQVESRYKCVNKRTKKAVENNCTSGASFQETPYDEEIRQIMQQDDSIFPEVMVSPGIIKHKTAILEPLPVSPSSTAASSSRRRQKRCGQSEYFEKYFELQEKKLKIKMDLEMSRQKRHEETTSLLKELISKQ